MFRGKLIKLQVNNPEGRNNCVKRMRINGSEAGSHLIKVEDHSENIIKVEVDL
jgi:hypothetical protein